VVGPYDRSREHLTTRLRPSYQPDSQTSQCLAVFQNDLRRIIRVSQSYRDTPTTRAACSTPVMQSSSFPDARAVRAALRDTCEPTAYRLVLRLRHRRFATGHFGSGAAAHIRRHSARSAPEVSAEVVLACRFRACLLRLPELRLLILDGVLVDHPIFPSSVLRRDRQSALPL
jgi:hypothetical protein